MSDKPILQLALDLLNLENAIAIAEEAKESVDWIEAGTPLIKSEGMNAIRQLKQRFPDKVIVADMKTMDTGAFETEMAAKAGADVVCVLGASDDSTIEEAVRAARRYGAKIMVDLIGVADKAGRVAQAKSLGADYACFHLGIDAQMRGESAIEQLRLVASSAELPLAAAGGLNSETVADAIGAGASIAIIGGAITKAEDVAAAAKMIRHAMDSKTLVRTEFFKKYSASELVDAFSRVSSPNVSDAMHRSGAMFGIRSIRPGFKMAGRAFTVSTKDGDWAKPVEAIDRAEKGDVLVIDVSGGKTAVWGELATWSAKLKGIAGVVIDGAARDADAIAEIGLPLFSRYVVPNAGDPKGLGEMGCEIRCGGLSVRCGDWIIGDDSGVVVVPQNEATEIANRAVDVMEHENRLREEIRRGDSLSKVLKLKKWEKVIG
ncbi:MAG: bifunctional hexulose-6-phosphate synthase/ribonuclease regulator [Thermoplasmata archaeon HGW-Thermoplasmata-1]|nr:MAG: bifunctional hexulose-6-phosphate synthase/ribonuclease regulator [Thermoplasmata archaeon HGW-Thermoplasmata-1]